MPPHRAASRQGSTAERPTRFRAKLQTSPRSEAPQHRPRHKSPDAAIGLPLARQSGEEPFPSPSLAFAHEQQPIMQPKRPLLPELYTLRYHPEPRPVWRPRHRFFAKAARTFLYPSFKFGAAGERLRLVGRPGPDLAVARPARKIRVRFVIAHEFDDPLDPDLAVQRFPHEAQRGVRVGEQLLRLSAVEIG